MRIGIIGAGFIGRALARQGIANGHEVMVSNSRGPETLHSLPESLGCQIGTTLEAAEFSEVVIVAVPFSKYRSLSADALAGKVIIDPNNYYPERDGQIAELDERLTTTSQMIARHLTQSRVVKAFNAVLAADLENAGKPAGTPGRRALPIAADDADAKAMVAALQDQFGFDVVDAGPLSDSWRFERGKPGYCRPLDVAGWVKALASAQHDVELPTGSWQPKTSV